MLGVFIPNMEMPDTCIECPFISRMTEVMIGDGVYKKIAHCAFAHEHNIEDPWRNVNWLATHKELWCPLVKVDNCIIY